MCGLIDGTDVFILLLYVSLNLNENFYFRQSMTLPKEGITYRNIITALKSHLRRKYEPAFYALTSLDFTKLFYERSKITSFK